jgi:hypothetical protein
MEPPVEISLFVRLGFLLVVFLEGFVAAPFQVGVLGRIEQGSADVEREAEPCL